MSSPPSSTLVVVPPHLAGAVATLPALEILAASGRSVVVLAPRYLEPLFKLLPGVAAVAELVESEERTVTHIRRHECDEAVLLDSSLDGAWLSRAASIQARWGYRGGLRSLLLHPPVPRPRVPLPPWQQPSALLAAMDLPAPAGPPRLQLPPEFLQRGLELLERAHVPTTDGPLVALAPTSDLATAPRWPWPNFAELARSLRRRNPSVRQFIVGEAEQLWPAVRIHEETARFLPVIGPDLDVAQLAGVLAHLKLLITAESGPLHLAAALGVRCVALLGPRNPILHGPAGDGHHIVHGQQSWLLPGLVRARRLDGIAVEAVIAACEDVLAKNATENH